MVEIKLFGPTRVVLADGTRLAANELGGVKSRQVLEVLALTPGTPVAKDELADLLWDGRPPRTYLATLESYVCVLRRTLRLPRGRASALATTSRGYVLDDEQARVDVVDVRRLLHRTVGGGLEIARLVDRALPVASAPLLASEHGAEWVAAERDGFRRALVEGCGRAAEEALRCGEDVLAERLASAAAELDPMAEGAARTAMQALHRTGRRAEALRTYAGLRAVLVEELGLEPAPETHRVYLQVLAAEGTGRGHGSHREARNEVRALLGLLHQVLASVPGLELPPADRALAETVRVLVRSG